MKPKNSKISLWDFEKYREHEWFRFLVVVLILLGAAYLALHFVIDDDGAFEYSKLDERQMLQVNRIYFGDSVYNAADQPAEGEQEVAAEAGVQQPASRRQLNRFDAETARLKCERVIDYINSEFNNKVDTSQLSKFRSYLCTAPPLEAVSFLSNLRLRVASYFWLIGPTIYFEIIFWALFGVLGSLLFNLGLVYASRTSVPGNPQTTFDATEIPSQIAKMLYAPLCTLVIILGYNFFSDQNIVDISSSKGVIVFSFLGGFYSSRLIAFLDRLKEVILPTSGLSTAPAGTTAALLRLQNIKIDFQADPVSIPSPLLNEISEIGFAATKVKVTDAETGQVIDVKPVEDDQESEFMITEIKPGRYVIEADWSVEVDDVPVNLEAKETVQISATGQKVTIMLRKSDAEG